MRRFEMKRITIVSIALASVVWAGGNLRANAAENVDEPLPLTSHKTNCEISIDGKLTEPAWAEASKFRTFKQFRGNLDDAIPATEVRLLHDDANLYASFECDDRDVCSFSANDDDPLYERDVVEVFIHLEAHKSTYYEFIVAPNAAFYDARNLERGPLIGGEYKLWNSTAKRAATVRGTDGDAGDVDQGFTVEMAIPWAAFNVAARPASADWRIGLFRCDYSTARRNDQLLLMSINKASDFGFHTYEEYHPLTFQE